METETATEPETEVASDPGAEVATHVEACKGLGWIRRLVVEVRLSQVIYAL